jgi:hypothetical protein
MAWLKKGIIYKPNGLLEWSKSHAQLPVAEYIENLDVIKIYFSTRDKYSRSLPGYIVVDSNNPKLILEIAEKPILGLGDIGAFDDCGVMPSWITNYDNKKYLYYIGWNVRNTIPYHNSVGLAISNDGGVTFNKFANGPLWDRSYSDPYYSGTSCVIIDKGIWKNWYLSCTEWRIIDGRAEPRYHIKYAESMDGINWIRKGDVAIDYKSDVEAGIVKASVIIEDGIYKMWYSRRNFVNYRIDTSNSYRIGYAESTDGINWMRKDESVGIDIGNNEDFDSIMIEYPHVLDVKNRKYMFYNGNGFGISGIGYAELINELNT